MTIVEPISPLRLPSGLLIPMTVIPPVPVQQAALSKGEPLSFLMGARGFGIDEEPRHRVIIPAPFYLGTYPVTQAVFAEWTRSSVCNQWRLQNQDQFQRSDAEPHQNHFLARAQHPAENLNSYEAEAFCDWINNMPDCGLPAGFSACLPNEAQWEYACRAGTDTEYHNGDGEAALRETGWYNGNSGNSTQSVGHLAPNAWGLCDMHGNVWEWCSDVWDARAYSKRPDVWIAEPWTVESAGEDATFEHGIERLHPRRVMRGGCWGTSSRCRSTFRYRGRPRNRGRYLGFRLCLSPNSMIYEQTSPKQVHGLEARGSFELLTALE